MRWQSPFYFFIFSPDIYFLFANTEPFKSGCGKGVDRIIMLSTMESAAARVRFIKTTDAMIHARGGGESFGMAVAEWSVMNKPVFTTRTAGDATAQMAHADILGDKAQLYTCANVAEKLAGFDRSSATDWNAYHSSTRSVVPVSCGSARGTPGRCRRHPIPPSRSTSWPTWWPQTRAAARLSQRRRGSLHLRGGPDLQRHPLQPRAPG